jgi:hypothetical protein
MRMDGQQDPRTQALLPAAAVVDKAWLSAGGAWLLSEGQLRVLPWQPGARPEVLQSCLATNFGNRAGWGWARVTDTQGASVLLEDPAGRRQLHAIPDVPWRLAASPRGLALLLLQPRGGELRVWSRADQPPETLHVAIAEEDWPRTDVGWSGRRLFLVCDDTLSRVDGPHVAWDERLVLQGHATFAEENHLEGAVVVTDDARLLLIAGLDGRVLATTPAFWEEAPYTLVDERGDILVIERRASTTGNSLRLHHVEVVGLLAPVGPGSA